MVCLWSMSYEANSPWQHVCDGFQAFCSWINHKQQTRFMVPLKTIFLRSWQVQQFIICHVNLQCMWTLWFNSALKSTYSCMVWRGWEREREGWLTTVLWLKQIRLTPRQQVYPVLTLPYAKYLHLDEIRGAAQNEALASKRLIREETFCNLKLN